MGRSPKKRDRGNHSHIVDVAQLIDREIIRALRDEFKAADGDVTLEEFIRMMMFHCPCPPNRTVERIAQLTELFQRIDFDNSQSIDWEEFTNYTIEMGMVASRSEREPSKHHYQERASFIDSKTSGDIVVLKYVPEMNKVLVVEASSVVVKVYSIELALEALIKLRVSHPGDENSAESVDKQYRSAHSRKKQSSQRKRNEKVAWAQTVVAESHPNAVERRIAARLLYSEHERRNQDRMKMSLRLAPSMQPSGGSAKRDGPSLRPGQDPLVIRGMKKHRKSGMDKAKERRIEAKRAMKIAEEVLANEQKVTSQAASESAKQSGSVRPRIPSKVKEVDMTATWKVLELQQMFQKKRVQAEREAEQARAEALAEGKEMPEEDTKETSNSVQDDTFLDEGRKAPKVRRYNFFKDESDNIHEAGVSILDLEYCSVNLVGKRRGYSGGRRPSMVRSMRAMSMSNAQGYEVHGGDIKEFDDIGNEGYEMYGDGSKDHLAKSRSAAGMPAYVSVGIQERPTRRWGKSSDHQERQHFLAASRSDMTITLWNTKTFRLEAAIHVTTPQTMLKWSPQTNLLFSTAKDTGTLLGWNLLNRNCMVRLERHTDVITDLIDPPHHNLVITCGLDGKILLWDYTSELESEDLFKKPRFQAEFVGHNHGVRELAVIPRTDLLISAGFDTEALLWDLSTRLLLMRIAAHRHTLIGVKITPFKPYQAITADCSGVFKIWDVQQASQALEAPITEAFEIHLPNGAAELNTFVTTSPNDTLIAAGRRLHILDRVRVLSSEPYPSGAVYSSAMRQFFISADCHIYVIDATTGRVAQRHYNVLPSPCTALAMDYRGRKLLVGMADGRVGLINCANGYLLGTIESPHSQQVTSVVDTGPDANILSAAWDMSLRVSDGRTSATTPMLRLVERAHPSDIMCMAFSRELGCIATGGSGSCLRIWDYQDVSLLNSCEGHPGDITTVAFANPLPLPVVVAADTAGRILLWGCRPSLWAGKVLMGVINTAHEGSTPNSGEGRQEEEASGEKTEVQQRRPAASDNPPAKPKSRWKTFMTQSSENDKEQQKPQEKSPLGAPVSVSVVKVFVERVGEGPGPDAEHRAWDKSIDGVRFIMYTGDDRGVVKRWDLSELVQMLPVQPLPREKQPPQVRSYDPTLRKHRRFLPKDDDKHKRLRKSGSGTLSLSSLASAKMLASNMSSKTLLKTLSKRALATNRTPNNAVFGSNGKEEVVEETFKRSAKEVKEPDSDAAPWERRWYPDGRRASLASTASVEGEGSQSEEGSKEHHKPMSKKERRLSKRRASLLGTIQALAKQKAELFRARGRIARQEKVPIEQWIEKRLHPEVQPTHRWRAHLDVIVSLELLDSNALVTSSLDWTVRLWSTTGEPLGLVMNLLPSPAPATPLWQFSRHAQLHVEEEEEAKQLFEKALGPESQVKLPSERVIERRQARLENEGEVASPRNDARVPFSRDKTEEEGKAFPGNKLALEGVTLETKRLPASLSAREELLKRLTIQPSVLSQEEEGFSIASLDKVTSEPSLPNRPALASAVNTATLVGKLSNSQANSSEPSSVRPGTANKTFSTKKLLVAETRRSSALSQVAPRQHDDAESATESLADRFLERRRLHSQPSDTMSNTEGTSTSGSSLDAASASAHGSVVGDMTLLKAADEHLGEMDQAEITGLGSPIHSAGDTALLEYVLRNQGKRQTHPLDYDLTPAMRATEEQLEKAQSRGLKVPSTLRSEYVHLMREQVHATLPGKGEGDGEDKDKDLATAQKQRAARIAKEQKRAQRARATQRRKSTVNSGKQRPGTATTRPTGSPTRQEKFEIPRLFDAPSTQQRAASAPALHRPGSASGTTLHTVRELRNSARVTGRKELPDRLQELLASTPTSSDGRTPMNRRLSPNNQPGTPRQDHMVEDEEQQAFWSSEKPKPPSLNLMLGNLSHGPTSPDNTAEVHGIPLPRSGREISGRIYDTLAKFHDTALQEPASPARRTPKSPLKTAHRTPKRLGLDSHYDLWNGMPRVDDNLLIRSIAKPRLPRRHRFGRYNMNDVLKFKKLWEEFDADYSGNIDLEEFMNSPMFLSDPVFAIAKSLFRSIDRDGSGDVSIREFMDVLFPLAPYRDRQAMYEEMIYLMRQDILAAIERKKQMEEAAAENRELNR